MRRRLPLLITALLSVVVIAFTWSAYRSLRTALIAAAGDRVVSVAQRLAANFAESDDRLRREGSPLSRDPVVRRALLTADAGASAARSGVA